MIRKFNLPLGLADLQKKERKKRNALLFNVQSLQLNKINKSETLKASGNIVSRMLNKSISYVPNQRNLLHPKTKYVIYIQYIYSR